MKLSASILFAALSLLGCSSAPAATYHEDVVLVEYAEFENCPVQMVLRPDDERLILRIALTHKECSNDNALEFLKQEVIRLTSSQKPIELGSTGISFTFVTGHPIWGPHGLYAGDGRRYECLFFAERASIVDSHSLIAMGSATTPPYDGYEEWQPQR